MFKRRPGYLLYMAIIFSFCFFIKETLILHTCIKIYSTVDSCHSAITKFLRFTETSLSLPG